MTSSQTSSRPERKFLLAWLVVVTLGAGWLLLRHLDDSVLGHSQFRQTQTALSVEWAQREGAKIAYLTPLFGPPWSVPMEFPLYQWCAAQVASITRSSTEVAGRCTSMFFFFGSLVSLVGLARRWESDRWRVWLVAGAVLLTPVIIYYSRSVMIESAAAAFSIWFLHAFWLALERRDWLTTLLAALLGVTAAMIKITTFGTILVPVAVIWAAQWWQQPALRRSPSFWRSTLIPLGASLGFALWWVRYSDQIKSGNPLSSFLTSENLHSWNFGTLSQRCTLLDWSNAMSHFLEGGLNWPGILVILLATVLAPAAYRRVAIVTWAAYLASVLVFFNLYVVHDYYQFTAVLLVGASSGLVLAGALARSRWLGSALILAFSAAQFWNFSSNWWEYWRQPAPKPPDMAAVINAALPPDGVLVVYGYDWNARIPYHTHRRAIMVPEHRPADATLLDQVIPRLPSNTPLALLVSGRHQTNSDFIRWHTSRLGLRANALLHAPEGDLYVMTKAVKEVHNRRDEWRQADMVFDWQTHTGPLDPALLAQTLSHTDFTPISNASLLGAYSPWPLSPIVHDNTAGVLASAPSEMHISLPVGARQATIRFGMLPGSFNGNSLSDGAEASVVFVSLDGTEQVLWRRSLQPRDHPGDREVQQQVIELPVNATGKLVCVFSPGPKGDAACDWTFWQKIEIH